MLFLLLCELVFVLVLIFVELIIVLLCGLLLLKLFVDGIFVVLGEVLMGKGGFCISLRKNSINVST